MLVHMKNILILIIALTLLAPSTVSATHKSQVGGQVIDSNDRGIYEAHEPNCGYRHYHGTLGGVADPAPEGCGHGEVKIILHGEGDGESIPPPPAKGAWESFTTWIGSWFTKENAKNVVDVAAEANGIPPPFQTAEIVDSTKETTPAIKEKIDNIKEYRENVSPEEDTLGIYNNPDKGGDSISDSFFKWFNNLLK